MTTGDADKRSLRHLDFLGVPQVQMSSEQKGKPLLLVYLEDFFVFGGDEILAFFLVMGLVLPKTMTMMM